MVLLYFVVSIAVALIPLIGVLVYPLVSVLLFGGLMAGCAVLDAGRPLGLRLLLSGLRRRPTGLVLAGGFYLIGNFLVSLFAMIGLVAVVGDVGAALLPEVAGENLLPVIAIMLMAFLCLLLLTMAIWFAPVLIIRHEITSLVAMRLSFTACTRNLAAVMVWGLVALVGAVLGLLTAGLGLLLVVPTLIASTYVAYRAILAA